MPAYTTNYSVIWNYDISDIGKIKFSTNFGYMPATSNLFRYVVIPGNCKLTATGLRGKSMEEISKMAYSDFCKALGIPE